MMKLRYGAKRSAVVTVVVAGAWCAGCGSNGTKVTVVSPRVGPDAQRLRAALPAGFVASSRGAGGQRGVLRLRAVAGLRPSLLVVAPFPAGEPIVASVINQPVSVLAHPIFVSTTKLTPGSHLTVAAAHLPRIPDHTVLFILQGPAYRGDHLAATADGVAAGVMTLPPKMARGTWFIAVEDLSGVSAGSNGKLRGRALVDLGALRVG